MRECQKCGYIEPPYWRNVRQRLFTQYCLLEELKIIDPKLAERVRTLHDLVENNYIYHLVKNGLVVQRIHVSDSKDGKSWREPEQEKHYHFRPLNQRRLDEIVVGEKNKQ